MRDSLAVRIVGVRQENPEVTTLYFKRPFEFVAGQYITVYIEGSTVRLGKAYSISSCPTDELMSITIKDVGGEFSSYLCEREIGDVLQISRAYGFFNPETKKPLVGITAGCGLSPIWSVMSQTGGDLFFSHKSPQYTVFDRELAESDLEVRHFSTRERIEEKEGWYNGRFDVARILEQVADDSHFLVCGGVDFVRDVWQKLTNFGVDAKRISTETFFES